MSGENNMTIEALEVLNSNVEFSLEEIRKDGKRNDLIDMLGSNLV